MTWLPLRVEVYVAPTLCNEPILGKDWLKQNRAQLMLNLPSVVSGWGKDALGKR